MLGLPDTRVSAPEPRLERLEDRRATRLAHLAALLGGLATDVSLDSVETGDAGRRASLAIGRGRVAGLQLVEVPPGLCPAERQLEVAWRIWTVG